MKDKLIGAIVDLLKVKTLITLVLIFTTCYLAVDNRIDVAVFTTLVSAVITYYFTKKDSGNNENQ